MRRTPTLQRVAMMIDENRRQLADGYASPSRKRELKSEVLALCHLVALAERGEKANQLRKRLSDRNARLRRLNAQRALAVMAVNAGKRGRSALLKTLEGMAVTLNLRLPFKPFKS